MASASAVPPPASRASRRMSRCFTPGCTTDATGRDRRPWGALCPAATWSTWRVACSPAAKPAEGSPLLREHDTYTSTTICVRQASLSSHGPSGVTSEAREAGSTHRPCLAPHGVRGHAQANKHGHTTCLGSLPYFPTERMASGCVPFALVCLGHFALPSLLRPASDTSRTVCRLVSQSS